MRGTGSRSKVDPLTFVVKIVICEFGSSLVHCTVLCSPKLQLLLQLSCNARCCSANNQPITITTTIRAGRSPIFWDPGAPLNGLAGTRGFASPREQLFSFNREWQVLCESLEVDSDSRVLRRLAGTQTRGYPDSRVPLSSSNYNMLLYTKSQVHFSPKESHICLISPFPQVPFVTDHDIWSWWFCQMVLAATCKMLFPRPFDRITKTTGQGHWPGASGEMGKLNVTFFWWRVYKEDLFAPNPGQLACLLLVISLPLT